MYIRLSQKICNVRHNLAAFGDFQSLEDDKPHETESFLTFLPVLEHNLRIPAYRPTWPCLIIKVLAVIENFLKHLFTWLWSIAPLPFA